VDGIRSIGLDEILAERLEAGVPVLGICIGMQVLFESSDELGGAEGLGLLRGRVRPLEAAGLKLPQIGWNAVRWHRPSRLTQGLPPAPPFYHVHSFAPVPEDADIVLGTAEYGASFVSAVEHGSLWGVQFHPEKSSADGLALLANFAGACASRAAAARARSAA
jgi:glutamine amidotransferase